MKITRVFFAKLAVYFIVLLMFSAEGYSAIINAASPSYSDVNSAVSSANSGDTVIVPAGSATWTSSLFINKGLTLKGAGSGNTIITGNLSSGYLVSYDPLNPSLNEPFRLTGFHIDGTNALILNIEEGDVFNIPTNIRVDNNVFDCAMVGGKAAMYFVNFYGVIDNNTFNGECHLDNLGLQVASWTNLVYNPGSIDNIYYEDNIFNICVVGDSGGYGGRYLKRYNTYNLSDPRNCFRNLNGFYPLFDAHGNQGSGVYATMGVEIYGNKINTVYEFGKWLDHRGGKAIVFFNKVVGTNSGFIAVTEEHADYISPPALNPTDGTPQHSNNGYYWNNRKGPTGSNLLTGMDTSNGCSACADVTNVIEENDDYFNYDASFDGSSGVGCGTLANRPATCTTGVGYWAGDQSCDSISDSNVGVNPATPLSGTLYKCTTTNTWTEYFTPFTYPHPLRTGAVMTTPKKPVGVIGNIN